MVAEDEDGGGKNMHVQNMVRKGSGKEDERGANECSTEHGRPSQITGLFDYKSHKCKEKK